MRLGWACIKLIRSLALKIRGFYYGNRVNIELCLCFCDVPETAHQTHCSALNCTLRLGCALALNSGNFFRGNRIIELCLFFRDVPETDHQTCRSTLNCTLRLGCALALNSGRFFCGNRVLFELCLCVHEHKGDKMRCSASP